MPHFIRLTAILSLSLVLACGDDGGDTSNPPDTGADTTPDAGADVAEDVAEDGGGDVREDAAEDVAPDIDYPDLPDDLEHPDEGQIFDFANGCVVVGTGEDDELRYLARDGAGYAFDATSTNEAAQFSMKAADLGSYLFYDREGGYVVVEDGPIVRQESLDSDVYLVDDTYVSGAQWQLEFSEWMSFRYQLRHTRTGMLLGEEGLVTHPSVAAQLTFEGAEGCTEHPEMSVDATGTVTRTTFDDGDLFGFADTHSHILVNFGFGGGGIFHGQAFHPLGVEVAMGSCEPFHGPDGRADFLGWGFGAGAASGDDLESLISLLGTGLLPDPVHETDGWPTFSGWPNQVSATHQTQYYRWLERAWLSGLRLVVQHAVSNEALCEIMSDTGFQPVRLPCADMINIDRQLEEVHNMVDYIDAQSGGPGEGWFRVVTSPAEARQVISEGKLAVVLGIEVPNLFECQLNPRPGAPECDTDYINEQLDRYHALGVRALFPNHKFDNAFTPGDGMKGIMEIANFYQTAHWSNYVDDCPDVPTVFDRGSVQFGGLNQPRDEYLEDAPNDRIELSENPLNELLPYAALLMEPSLDGDWCQKHGLTEAGEALINGMIARGFIPEIDHLPRRAYLDAFAILESVGYPAIGTHGNTNNGRIYEIGGASKAGFSRCADPDNPGSMANRFRQRRDMLAANDLYPAEGFGFDFNGLAGVPNSRFGPDANCGAEQENPVTYPFMSFAGDVTFTEPAMGQRVVDFNTEGMIHIGLVPELIEDARRTGVSDEDMEIVFRSAEAYIRLWERAEARAAEINGE